MEVESKGTERKNRPRTNLYILPIASFHLILTKKKRFQVTSI